MSDCFQTLLILFSKLNQYVLLIHRGGLGQKWVVYWFVHSTEFWLTDILWRFPTALLRRMIISRTTQNSCSYKPLTPRKTIITCFSISPDSCSPSAVIQSRISEQQWLRAAVFFVISHSNLNTDEGCFSKCRSILFPIFEQFTCDSRWVSAASFTSFAALSATLVTTLCPVMVSSSFTLFWNKSSRMVVKDFSSCPNCFLQISMFACTCLL